MPGHDIPDSTPTAAVSHKDAIGESEAFVSFQERLSRAAKVDRPVLIIGERGTGKELAASRLHYLSLRWQGPLVALNCAALTPSLIESELFGHERGAFTGAVSRRLGRFEQADGGTLFLDEIGLIPLQVQEKILRVVEYGTFERVGGARPVKVNVRIIGATNRDLAALCNDGSFKRDFLDRLSFEVLFLPPLRERKGDILLLASHFASRMAFEMGRPGVVEFSDQAEHALENYSWPGNVRELKNVVERAVYRADSELIHQIDFNPFLPPQQTTITEAKQPAARIENPAPPPTKSLPPANYADTIRRVEIDLLRRALDEALHNQRRAAEILGMSYHQFRWLYRKYKDDAAFKAEEKG